MSSKRQGDGSGERPEASPATPAVPEGRAEPGVGHDSPRAQGAPSAGEPASGPNFEPSSRGSGAGRLSFPPGVPTLLGSGPIDLSKASGVPGILAPGSKFGVYLVGGCIGEGGMARIYRAEHAGLRRQVALKVLIDGFASNPDGRERFLREARMAAAIKHPNVVNIFDVGVHEGVPYLVMELLEGKDLEKLLEPRRPLDEALIIDVMVPVVAGLIAVHDAGIVHRDLKPGNIFLAQGRYNDLEPKLLDFGISKAAGPDQPKLTVHRTFMGTPFYISPEGLRGGEMTPRSDQYSLGIVMYECATGVPPFLAPSFADLSARIASGQYTPVSTHNPELSKRLVRIIERAMSLDPEQRFKDLREMGRELLLLAGQRTRITWGLSFGEAHPTLTSNPTTYAAGVSAPPPGAPQSERRSALAWAFAVLLMAALVVASLSWWFGSTTSRPGASLRPAASAQASATAPPPTARANEENRNPAAFSNSPVAAAPADVPSLSDADAGLKRPPAVRRPVAPDPPTPAPVAAAKARVVAPAMSARRPVPGKAPSADPDPEWALPAVVPPAQQSGPSDSQRGVGSANGAPIFD